MNYVGAKLLARKEKKTQENAKPSPEEAAMRYYREFMEKSLHRHIGAYSTVIFLDFSSHLVVSDIIPRAGFFDRATVFHDVSRDWIYSIYASGIGVSSWGIYQRATKPVH